MKLTLIPFQSVTGNLPREITRRVRSILPWRFSVAPSLRDPVPFKDLTTVSVEQILALLSPTDRHDELTIALTSLDLCVPGLDYVFGYAAPERRAGVVSLYRLVNDNDARRHRRRLLVERAAKEILHEAGHLMGLPHCDDPMCVMRYSQALQDTDIKRCQYCARCLKELSRMPEPAGER